MNTPQSFQHIFPTPNASLHLTCVFTDEADGKDRNDLVTCFEANVKQHFHGNEDLDHIRQIIAANFMSEDRRVVKSLTIVPEPN